MKYMLLNSTFTKSPLEIDNIEVITSIKKQLDEITNNTIMLMFSNVLLKLAIVEKNQFEIKLKLISSKSL